MFEIKRKILEDLKKHLKKQEISMIVGPRQAGKTTVMLMLQRHLDEMGEKSILLNFDVEKDRHFFTSQESLLAKLGLEFGGDGGVVFIDEIQRKEDAGLFLKGLYDSKTPYKFVVSGSGSIELKEKIHESLVGRKRLFHLNTVSFDEFVNFRTNYKYEERLDDFFCVEAETILPGLLNEYMNFGGYPRVLLSDSLEEKERVIDEIYSSYLIKDISFLLNVDKLDAIGNLFKVLSSQIGQLINYSELASLVGVSQATLKNYIYYGEKTFVIERMPPFYKNPRKEIVKSPVAYFSDLGLRNYCSGWFGKLVDLVNMGFPFQNFVWQLLRDRFEGSAGEVKFWRTKDKAEVDFIVDLKNEIVPIEVKFKSMHKPTVGRSLRSFIGKYKPKRAYVVNIALDSRVYIDSTEIRFIPYWRLFEI